MKILVVIIVVIIIDFLHYSGEKTYVEFLLTLQDSKPQISHYVTD